jgi:hypothetical protein
VDEQFPFVSGDVRSDDLIPYSPADLEASAQLPLMTVFLHVWETENPVDALDRVPRS